MKRSTEEKNILKKMVKKKLKKKEKTSYYKRRRFKAYIQSKKNDMLWLFRRNGKRIWQISFL